ncbi:MAG: hypothetical protein JWP87_181 [Labilithrix sp.]|nr:hypothetical protein [Labilithrix sp.]
MAYRDLVPSSVLVAGIGPHLVGAAADTGKLLWKATIGSTKDKDVLRIALDEENVIAARGNELWCLHQRSGKIEWKVQSPIGATTVLTDGGRIYVAYGGEVACFNREGQLLWHELLHGAEGAVTLAAGGVVVHADYVR